MLIEYLTEETFKKIQSLKNTIELNENIPRRKYFSRGWDERKKKCIIHWGQRKLLIGEIYFL